MSLTTATQLKAALATYSLRTDQTSNWDDFIRLAEAAMERELRTRQMVQRSEATIDNEFEDLPTDFAEPVTFVIEGTPQRNLQYLTADQLNIAKQYTTQSGQPQYYTIVGPQFRFYPAPDQSYTGELTYYQRLPPLSENAQNWVLYRHPDAYLYGALLQFAIMAGDERLSIWTQAFASAIDAIKRSDQSIGALTPIPTYAA